MSIPVIKETFIDHAQAHEVFGGLDRLYAYGGFGNSASAMMLLGAPGMGKTTTVLAWASNHPACAGQPTDRRPVAYAKITGSRRTYRSIAGDILEAFGDTTMFPRETARDLVRRIIARMREQGTRVLLIDEGQLLVSSEKNRVIYDVAEWLKTLLNDSPCGICFIGSDEMLKAVDYNQSFRRRVEEVIELRPYDWNAADDRQEIREFLATLGDLVEGLDASCLATADTAARIAIATGGKVVGYGPRLVAKALSVAPAAGGRLDHDLLARAYDAFDTRPEYRAGNPFRGRPSAPAPVLPGGPTGSPKGTGPRRRPTPDEVLKP